MLKQTSQSYAKMLNINLDERLKPVSQSVDEMITRLEEFDTMIMLVQQERCNSIGITGSLTETIDYKAELKNLCNRIDALEKIVDHAKNNIDMLENKVEVAEKQFGISDGTSKLKNFLAPIFKKNSTEEGVSTEIIAKEPFRVEKYFVSLEGSSSK
ncbi:hypothetical protein Trydic_g16856 [Trypoxylus dichotomus]